MFDSMDVAICPECHNAVIVDTSKKAAICRCCGEPFVVADAINKTVGSGTSGNSSATSHISGESCPDDFVIVGGVLKEYKGAGVVVEIPFGVQEIGMYCFNNLRIKRVTIPSSVTCIGYGAFKDCKSLERVDVYAGLDGGLTHINDWAFSCCTNLKSVYLTSTVEYIGDCAFFLCKNLSSINVPYGARIGKSAFEGCESL